MKLSQNFSLSEFIDSRFFNGQEQQRVIESFEKDKDNLLPNAEKLAANLQILRDHLAAPVTINIAYRPKWYELSKGRKGGSRHVSFMAADISVSGYTPDQVADAIEKLIAEGQMTQGGLGRYNTFTHYDIRGTKARWDYR